MILQGPYINGIVLTTSNKNSYYVLKFDFLGITTNEKDLNDLEESFKSCIYSGIYDFIKIYPIDYQIPKEYNSADMMKSS